MKALRILFIIFLLLSLTEKIQATHNRAGEITYEWIGSTPQELRYRVTITTYTKLSSTQADRPSLDSVYWGDGSPPAVFPRTNFVDDVANDIRHNTYINEHTYSGNGEFLIHFTDPNRNADIVNIPHSVSEPFYLESLLKINPFLGNNNSPVMTYAPIDQGCVNRIFIHNPGAFDPDPRDSLSYELVEPGGAGGQTIPGYFYPPANNSFTLDPVRGDLIWDSPQATGEYNVAFNIIQWRDGIQIGFVRRDMQILIRNCDDYPPVIDVVQDTCVLAGDSLSFLVTATDRDLNDIVLLSASGGALNPDLVPDPAIFTSITANNDTVTSKFFWQTECHHIRPQPYYVQFKVASGSAPTLVDLSGTFIRVIPPPPPFAEATPNGSFIDLHWTPPPCSGILHYNIYRRAGMYPGNIPCPCDAGAPGYSGYTLIGSTQDSVENDTTFTDDNNGQGLTIGIEYCYIITAVYPNGAESCASPQTCATLKKDAPVITHADVRHTDAVNGSVYVGWSPPTDLDTTIYKPPYEYRVYRSAGFFGADFSTLVATFGNLNDTSVVDTLLDTDTQPWSYKIELWYTDSATSMLTFKGQTAVASTIFLTIAPTDNQLNLSWEEHVPWSNSRYDIFKQNASLTFDSIASVTTPSFSDTGLVNGQQYCYYIRSIGSYFFSGFIDPIVNRSEIECMAPFDNVHPCSPDLTVQSDCNESLNMLTWTNPNNSCADDVLKYYIYFGPSETGGFERIDSLLSPFDTTYIHEGLSMISGCYKVTAVDSVGNETLEPEVVCVDTCRQYVLPSVFTPNGDGFNDLFHPCDSTTAQELQEKNCPPYKNVNSVEMKIYNRWGKLVFETTDKDINWDGKYMNTSKDCPTGVYYYTCKVFFFSVKEVVPVELHGTIDLIRP